MKMYTNMELSRIKHKKNMKRIAYINQKGMKVDSMMVL